MIKTGVTEFYVQCLICGKFYQTLSQHLRFKHQMTAREYKEQFGLNYNQPLEARTVTEKRRKRAYQYGTYKVNCLIKGKATQHKKGGPGNKRLCPQRLEQLRSLRQNYKFTRKKNGTNK